MPPQAFNRREFLQTTALAGGVLALGNITIPQADAASADLHPGFMSVSMPDT